MANWKVVRKPFASGDNIMCAYESEVPYTVAMLIGDLLEGGIEISSVKYQSDEQDEDNFCGGNLSAKGFCSRYDQIRVKSKVGMNYEVFCTFNDIAFTAAMSDNGEGASYNKIAFSAARDSGFDPEAILSKI